MYLSVYHIGGITDQCTQRQGLSFVTCQVMSHVKLCHMSSFVTCQVMSHVKLCHMSSYVTCQVMSHVKLCHMSSGQQRVNKIHGGWIETSQVSKSVYLILFKIFVGFARTSTENDERDNFDELVIKVVVETDLLVRG